MTACGTAKSNSAFEQGFKNRFQIGLRVDGGAADDLQHVGGGGLLLQRLAQLIEQPRVLDGDNGFAWKSWHPIEVFVFLRTNLFGREVVSTQQCGLSYKM